MRNLYKVDYLTNSIKQVTGTQWPENDSDGDGIFENTHFVNESDAWEEWLDNLKAHLSILSRQVEQSREEVIKQEKTIADVAITLSKAFKKYDKFKESRE